MDCQELQCEQATRKLFPMVCHCTAAKLMGASGFTKLWPL